MDGNVRRAIKRNRLLKRYSRHKTPASWEKYRVQRNYTTSLIRLNKVKYGDPKISPKKWWGIVKSLYGQKMRVAVPTLIEGQNK
jgi:hypothetical protein